MAVKGSKELARTERPRFLTPFTEMERWFEEAWHRPFSMMRSMWPQVEAEEFETALPSLDIYEEGNDLVVKADLPGIKKEDVDIHLADNVLTISGERKSEEKIEKGKYYAYERRYGSFYRRFELPFDVESGKTKAHFENGVLEIRLTKSREAEIKDKKISID